MDQPDVPRSAGALPSLKIHEELAGADQAVEMV
jgi:hypothetical protein